MKSDKIIATLPYKKPFLFVDKIIAIDENGISGTYTFDESHDFYKGHFKDNPVTPGAILTEAMAQIGVVSLGIYLLHKSELSFNEIQIALTSTEIDFFQPVFPGETVFVKSKKEYFRFNKLKCKVEMLNSKDELVCRGKIAGMITNKTNNQHE